MCCAFRSHKPARYCSIGVQFLQIAILYICRLNHHSVVCDAWQNFSVCVCNWLEWALLAYYTHFLENSLSWCGLIQKAQELCLSFAVHVFCLLKLQPAVSILPAKELFLILGKQPQPKWSSEETEEWGTQSPDGDQAKFCPCRHWLSLE